jgi:hypothetical protein
VFLGTPRNRRESRSSAAKDRRTVEEPVRPVAKWVSDIPGLEALLSLADVQWASLAYLEVEFLPRLGIGVDRIKARLRRHMIESVRDGVVGARQRVDGL